MGRRTKEDKVNREEYRAEICMDIMIEFRDQLKFPTDTEHCYCDHRKLSDYNLQQFRDFVARRVNRSI
jgi:hypothetical protein